MNFTEINIINFTIRDFNFSIVPGYYLNLNEKLIQNFYELCNDKTILRMIAMENSNSTNGKFTLKNAKRFIEESKKYYNKKHLSYFLMDHQIIGLFIIKDINPIPEIGYFLKKSYRNKGIGKAFVGFMIELLSEYFDGFEAIVEQRNIPSLKILESLNFRIIDFKNGKYKLRRLF